MQSHPTSKHISPKWLLEWSKNAITQNILLLVQVTFCHLEAVGIFLVYMLLTYDQRQKAITLCLDSKT